MSFLSASVCTPRCWDLANGARRKSDSRGNVGDVGSVTESHVFPSLPLTETSAVTQAQRSATVPDITARTRFADFFGLNNLIPTQSLVLVNTQKGYYIYY